MSPESPPSHPPAVRWALLGGTGALLLTALLVAEFRRPLNSDSAWLLYLARRVVQGDRLYVDLVEINPPLVVWLQLPLIHLAEWLGLDPTPVFRAGVLVWIGSSLVLCARLLRLTLPRPQDRFWILLAIIVVLVGWTRAHFGEREHLALAALLPYLFATAAAAQERSPGPSVRLFVGALAALGLALKPHFLLVWIASLGYVAWKRRGGAWAVGPENLVILGFLLLYATTILLAVPDYLALVRLLGSTYQAFARKSLGVLVFDSAEALCALAAIFAYGIVRRSSHWPDGGDVFALATAAFVVAVLVQGKGFSYHYYPVSGCTLLLAAVALVGREGLPSRVLERTGALTLGILLLLGAASGIGWSLIQLCREEPQYVHQRQMAAYIRGHTTDGSVLRLGYEDNFPTIDQAGARWTMRFPNLWFVQAAYAEQLASNRQLEYRIPARMSAPERWCFEAVVADFVRGRPDLLMIVRPHPTGVAGVVTRLDYLRYLSQDSRFVAALRSYDSLGEVAGYSVFRRRTLLAGAR